MNFHTTNILEPIILSIFSASSASLASRLTSRHRFTVGQCCLVTVPEKAKAAKDKQKGKKRVDKPVVVVSDEKDEDSGASGAAPVIYEVRDHTCAIQLTHVTTEHPLML